MGGVRKVEWKRGGAGERVIGTLRNERGREREREEKLGGARRGSIGNKIKLAWKVGTSEFLLRPPSLAATTCSRS